MHAFLWTPVALVSEEVYRGGFYNPARRKRVIRALRRAIPVAMALLVMAGSFTFASTSMPMDSPERAAALREVVDLSSVIAVVAIEDTINSRVGRREDMATDYVAATIETLKGTASKSIRWTTPGGSGQWRNPDGELLRVQTQGIGVPLKIGTTYLVYLERCADGRLWIRQSETIVGDSLRARYGGMIPYAARRDSVMRCISAVSVDTLVQHSDAVVTASVLGGSPRQQLTFLDTATVAAVVDSVWFLADEAPSVSSGDTIFVSASDLRMLKPRMGSTPSLTSGPALMFLERQEGWSLLPSVYAVRRLDRKEAHVDSRSGICCSTHSVRSTIESDEWRDPCRSLVEWTHVDTLRTHVARAAMARTK